MASIMIRFKLTKRRKAIQANNFSQALFTSNTQLLPNLLSLSLRTHVMYVISDPHRLFKCHKCHMEMPKLSRAHSFLRVISSNQLSRRVASHTRETAQMRRFSQRLVFARAVTNQVVEEVFKPPQATKETKAALEHQPLATTLLSQLCNKLS